jgi:hypothetical protein
MGTQYFHQYFVVQAVLVELQVPTLPQHPAALAE